MKRILSDVMIVSSLVLGSLSSQAVAGTRQGNEGLFDTSAEAPAIEFRPSVAAPSPAPSRAGDIQTGNPLWSIPLTSLVATRDRPIFSPSRRPVALAAPSAPMPAAPQSETPLLLTAPKPLMLTLIGTISGTSDGIAIVQDPATRDVLRLRLGDVHSGWTLSSVRTREVTFNKGSLQEALTIAPPEQNSAGVPLPGIATAPTGEVYN